MRITPATKSCTPKGSTPASTGDCSQESAPGAGRVGYPSYLCHCLKLTNADVRNAVVTCELQSVAEVRNATGAGAGCTACHCRIRNLIAECAARRARESAGDASVQPLLATT